MTELPDKKNIRRVYRNVQKHRHIEQLIRRFSSNKKDIRVEALNPVDVSSSRRVLELGCAFGAFTEALKGRLHPEASIEGLDMIAEYKPFFLEACRRAGYPGVFSAQGIDSLNRRPGASYDLILCSYALYFFVEMIPEIARLLKQSGIFVTITHDLCNMQELIHITRKTLKDQGLLENHQMLPVEMITRRFSSENGQAALQPYFGDIQKLDFRNTLVFQPWDIYFFVDYFQFKSPFFLTGTGARGEATINKLLHQLQDMSAGRKVISMCKDDAIFICSNPVSIEDES